MPRIYGISDRVYCLEPGQVIATGRPRSAGQPCRVASYLGTDERAINRSGGPRPDLAPIGNDL